MKPERVKGTRDFSPSQVNRRNYIFNTLAGIFVNFGFQAIETPAMERLSTLEGKYGEEGDNLLYKLRTNKNLFSTLLKRHAGKPKGEHSIETTLASLKRYYPEGFVPMESDKGLRYDLTVPFARYAVMHRNEIQLPFKRYQIQNVWRGDRPQKGRYREFYQCDVDVIGSDSLLYEAELIQIYDQAFAAFGLKVVIRLNNRKLLEGLAAYCGHADLFQPIVVLIDKLDKITWEGVARELKDLGLNERAIAKAKSFIACVDLEDLMNLAGIDEIEVARQGIEELREVLSFLKEYTFQNQLQIDFSLARGLSYYTGCIYEVVVDTKAKGQEKIKMGSIGGGGRYANLTGIFGWKGISGVGVSFGADRIYDVLEELNLFDDENFNTTKVLIMAMGKAELKYGFSIAQKLRKVSVATEVFPDVVHPKKLSKKLKYPDSRRIPYVVIIGKQEMQSGRLQVKDMQTRTETQQTLDGLIQQWA